MSRFTLLVLLGDELPVSADRALVEGTVGAALEPFDATIPVPPYLAPCSCRGLVARARVSHTVLAHCTAAASSGDSSATTLRDVVEMGVAAWVRVHPAHADHPMVLATVREDLTAPLVAALDALLALQPDRDASVRDCAGCAGRGVTESTTNPEARFDQWSMGVPLPRDGTTTPFASDILPVASLDPSAASGAVDAVLTADGTWHENVQRGWSGLDASEHVIPTAAFVAHTRALIVAHREGLAVVVRCHW